MKLKLGFLLCILLLAASVASAQRADSLMQDNSVKRLEQRNEYYSVYSIMPSLLGSWPHADFSYIATRFHMSGGDFYHPQLFNKHN